MKINQTSTVDDKLYLQTDVQSLKDFIDSINAHEDRWELLEKWLYRKSDEIAKRPRQVIRSLIKSDNELNKLFKGGNRL